MNRKVRRKLLRDGVNPKAIMDKYRADVYEQGVLDGIHHSAMTIMIITADVLHIHLGLGSKRLPEIMHQIHENIDAFNTGHLAPSDIDLMREELEKLNCYFEMGV